MISISMCMIAKNEESVLKRCLDSYSGLFDEIIIVDTGSTDTQKILLPDTPIKYMILNGQVIFPKQEILHFQKHHAITFSLLMPTKFLMITTVIYLCV